MKSNYYNSFSFSPLIPRFFIIAIAIAFYYYLESNFLLINWLQYIYYGVLSIIGYQIIKASAKTFTAPILSLILGMLVIFTSDINNINLISISQGWMLILMSVLGFLMAIFTRL